MSEISTYDWDFGDGNTSSLSSPTNEYQTGWYTVELEVLTSLGYYSTITKEYYIRVQNENLTNFDSEFLTGKRSLHFGWDNVTSLGWSENSGDNWIWSESADAIMNYTYLGDKYKLVWDLYDDKQYIINLGTGRISEDYTDKAISGSDGTDIASEIITPEFNGEKESYTMTHIQTDIHLRTQDDLSVLPSTFETDVLLYDSRSATALETKSNINEDAETVFFYQSAQTDSTKNRKIGLQMSESGYKLTSIDSMFKIEDRSRSASKDVDQFERDISCPTSWFTRGILLDSAYPPYGYDRISKTTNSNYANWSQDTGPDGYTSTAAKPVESTDGFTLTNYTGGSSGTIMLWAKQSDPTMVLDSYTFTQYGEPNGSWYKYYYTGVIGDTLTVTSNLPSLYDVRVYDSELDLETVAYYFDNYERFLPRF